MLAAFVLVAVYGTVGFMVIEHFSMLDAVFMTIATMSTVGLTPARHLDGPGEIFTITVVVSGVIAFLYTFGVGVELASSGRLQEYRRYHRMEERLGALRDHIIVCGYGRTGRKVVSELHGTGVPYVVIEMNPDPLEAVRRDEELHVVGDAAGDDVLAVAGVERARALVSCVDSDERNVYIVLTARSLNPRLFIVARSSYPDSVAKLTRAGADRVVSPYTASGSRMAALALQPAVVDVLDIVSQGTSRAMAIEELVVPDSVGAGEVTAGALRRSGAVLLAVRGGDSEIRVGPPDSYRCAPADIVVAMGTRDQLDALASVLRPT